MKEDKGGGKELKVSAYKSVMMRMNKSVMMEEGSCNRGMKEEMKKVGRIAAPMVVATVLQYLLPVVSLIMVGHLNQLALSSVAIATSLTNVFGFSVLVSRFSIFSLFLWFFCCVLCFFGVVIFLKRLKKRFNIIEG